VETEDDCGDVSFYPKMTVGTLFLEENDFKTFFFQKMTVETFL